MKGLRDKRVLHISVEDQAELAGDIVSDRILHLECDH